MVKLTFEVSEEQLVKLEAWLLKRIHSRFEHSIREWAFSRHSGIGESLRVRCSCGHEIDLTEYDKW